MLKGKYLHPLQLCQEGQLDHEHPQDPREWEAHHFVKDMLIQFLRKKYLSQTGRMYSQFDQVRQAHQQVLGTLEGPKSKQYVIVQAFI